MTSATVDVRTTPLQDAIDAARADPNAAVEWLMGFRQAGVHIDVQNHLTDHDDASISLPRGCGKTDQIIARSAIEIGRDPSLRIKCIKNAKNEAIKVSDAVRRVVDSPRFNMLYPRIQRDRDHWSGRSWRLRRPGVEKEPTFAAYGITETMTGGRADVLIYDDVCDAKNSIQFPALRERVKEIYRNTTQPMLVRKGPRRKGRVWRLYTPYHIDDLTRDWERNRHIQSMIQPVVGFDSPWPSEYPPEILRYILADIGQTAFDRAYRLMRISDVDVVIRSEWADKGLYWDPPERKPGMEIIGSMDPAFTRPRPGGLPKKHAPDWTAAVSAIVDTETMNIWILKVYRQQTTFPEYMKQLPAEFPGVHTWLCEAVQGQIGLIDTMNAQLPIYVIPMSPGEGIGKTETYDKRGRMAFTAPVWEAGKVHLRGRVLPDGTRDMYDAGHERAYDESTTFPAGANDDVSDAISQLVRYCRMRFEKKGGRDGDHRRAKVERSEQEFERQQAPRSTPTKKRTAYPKVRQRS